MIEIIKPYFRFVFLLAIVLFVNYPAITYHGIHPEQGPFYLANQQIHHWFDLLNIYANPERFYAGSIPYFRPSGHFLIYQLLMPWLGWHNPQALIVVNMIFLALTGFTLIQLYQLLFPSFRLGGYVAFALYLMHPALVFSHLTALQFDFAYIFFTLLSLYCFAVFCRQNSYQQAMRYNSYLLAGNPLKFLQLQNMSWLILTLLLYIIATTFKETAIMLGPVLAVYFIMHFYTGDKFTTYTRQLIQNRQCFQLLALLCVSSLVLIKYYSLQWDFGTNQHDQHYLLSLRIRFFDNIIYYAGLAAGLLSNEDPFGWRFRGIIFTPVTRLILYSFFILLLVTLIKLFQHAFDMTIKKPFIFLLCATIMFSLMPIFLGGSPWHLSLSILFICIAMGASFDYCFQQYISRAYTIIASVAAASIALSTIFMLQVHLHDKRNDTAFIMQLNYKAITNPPALSQLTPNSLLIVEDSQKLGEYALGDSFYPFIDKQSWQETQHKFFLKPDKTYSGMLFHWAYLLPQLQEEVYAFQINKMATVPNNVLSNWLAHYNDIFCVGYDNEANWHDRTDAFKAQLLAEKGRRQMVNTL